MKKFYGNKIKIDFFHAMEKKLSVFPANSQQDPFLPSSLSSSELGMSLETPQTQVVPFQNPPNPIPDSDGLIRQKLESFSSSLFRSFRNLMTAVTELGSEQQELADKQSNFESFCHHNFSVGVQQLDALQTSVLMLFNALEHVGSHIEQFSALHCSLRHDLLSKISETGWNFGSNLEDYKRKILQALEMTLDSRCKALLTRLETQISDSSAVTTDLKSTVDNLRHDSEIAFNDHDARFCSLASEFTGLSVELGDLRRRFELKDEQVDSLSFKVGDLQTKIQRSIEGRS